MTDLSGEMTQFLGNLSIHVMSASLRKTCKMSVAAWQTSALVKFSIECCTLQCCHTLCASVVVLFVLVGVHLQLTAAPDWSCCRIDMEVRQFAARLWLCSMACAQPGSAVRHHRIKSGCTNTTQQILSPVLGPDDQTRSGSDQDQSEPALKQLIECLL